MITRTWVAEDECGNTTTCSQVLLILDSEGPTFDQACPQDTEIECGSPIPMAPTLTASDNCGMASVTFSEESTFQPGSCQYTITRTWVAEDDCGNTTTCSQVITVSDTQAPVCPPEPADMQVACPDEVPTQGNMFAMDACQGQIMGLPASSISQGSGCVGDTIFVTQSWTFNDGCMNECVVDRVIAVVDDVPPMITTCPADITIAPEDSTEPEDTNGPAGASDNCGIEQVFYDDVIEQNPACIRRRWVAEDECGNTASCTQLIVVQGPCIVDLELTKDADLCVVQPGDNITFTITVTNNGEVSIGSLTIIDYIHNGPQETKEVLVKVRR
jgi:uncharacterized repeat protein (TIGR01451 family)